jgi:hypothetical protein
LEQELGGMSLEKVCYVCLMYLFYFSFSVLTHHRTIPSGTFCFFVA